MEDSEIKKNSNKSNYRIIKLTDSQMKNSDYMKSGNNLKNSNFSKNDLFKSNESNLSKNDSNFDFEKKLLISGEPEVRDYKLDLYKNDFIPQTKEIEKKEDFDINIINKDIEELSITYNKAKENLIYRQRENFGHEIIPIEEKGMIFHKFRNDPKTLTPLELDFLYNQKFIQNFISTQPENFLQEQILYIKIKIKLDELILEKKNLKELNEMETNKMNNEFYDTRSENKNDNNFSDLMSKEDYNSPNILSSKPTVKNYSSKNYKTFVIEEENSQDIENSNYFSQNHNEKSDTNSISNESEKKLKFNNAYRELQADQKHLQQLQKYDYNKKEKSQNHDILEMSDVNIEKKLHNTSKNLSFSLQSEKFPNNKINIKNSGISEKNKNIKKILLSEQVINNKIIKDVELNNKFESFKNIDNNVNPKDFESDILNNSNLNNSNINNNFHNLQSVVTFKNFGKNNISNNSEIKNNEKNDSENLEDRINYLNKKISNMEIENKNSKELIDLKKESDFLKNNIDDYEKKQKMKTSTSKKIDLEIIKRNLNHNDNFNKKFNGVKSMINSTRDTVNDIYSQKKIQTVSERKMLSPSYKQRISF